jgi:hypothetical protein
MSFQLKAPQLKISENDVRSACLQVLQLQGWWPVRQHVGRFQTPGKNWINVGVPGDPDYAIIKAPGFFLETKRPGGTLSDVQMTRIRQLKVLSGMDTVVVESVEQLMEWLTQRERSP